MSRRREEYFQTTDEDEYEAAELEEGEEPRASGRATKRINLKKIAIVAIALLLLFMVLGANQGKDYLVAKQNLAAGTLLTKNDLQVNSMNLGGSANNYLSGNTTYLNRTLGRALKSGELLKISDLYPSSVTQGVAVPIGVARSDMPYDLAPGQIVDLYIAPAQSASAFSKAANTNPTALLTGISVAGVDSKSSAYAMNTTVMLQVPRSALTYLPALLGAGRVILVRSS